MSKHELGPDDALNYERVPAAACKIFGSIRSDSYKAQVAGTSSLPRCLDVSASRAVALYRVTPREEFAPARRVVPRDSHRREGIVQKKDWKRKERV